MIVGTRTLNEQRMNVYLGLGSNLGDRRANLSHALDALARDQIRISRISPVVESPALLPEDAPTDWNRPFLNVVAECEAPGAPDALLDGLKATERELGRGEHERRASCPSYLVCLFSCEERVAIL